MEKKQLLEAIKRLNGYEDRLYWRRLKEHVNILNMNDDSNQEIFKVAEEKGLI